MPVLTDAGPAGNLINVTPSDTTIQKYRGLRIGGAGNIVIVGAGDVLTNLITLTVSAGEYVPFSVQLVGATGTTATGIVGYL